MTQPKPSLIRPEIPLSGVSTPVVSPIMPSVVYAAESPDALDAQYEGRTQGYTYAREGHPNADLLARRVDAMEGMTGGIVTGSGIPIVSGCGAAGNAADIFAS